MNLSATQKLILANQYEILKRVDPSQEKGYNLLLTCLYEGYDHDFTDLLPHFDKTISEEVRFEVRQILQMFRALYPPKYLAEKSVPAAVFAGFDGNEETEHYAYARFLLEERDLWRESRTGDYNTHSEVLPKYRRMLTEWNSCRDKVNLSPDDICRIAALAPMQSLPRVLQEVAE